MKTIRQLREDQRLTQLQLAYAVGVTPSTVYLWETGRSEPKVKQLRKLADVLGVRMDEIVLIEEPQGKRAA